MKTLHAKIGELTLGGKLAVACQAKLLGSSRGNVPPSTFSVGSRPHIYSPFAGSRMLQWLLRGETLHVGRLHVATLMKKMGTDAIYCRPSTSYVRDDRQFAGLLRPAALCYASRDRRQEHPKHHLRTFTGILQADAYGGHNPLFEVDRDPNPLRQAFCWAYARRKIFVLADITANAKR